MICIDCRSLLPALAAAVLCLAACRTTAPSVEASPADPPPPAAAEPRPPEEAAVEADEASDGRLTAPAQSPAEACAGGAIRDDGGVESGYGFVPSANKGSYVQQFAVADLASGGPNAVCVCWLRTRDDDDIDFDVVFYEGAERPARTPYARVAARATDVPKGKENAGTFYRVEVEGVTWPETENVFVGVQWDPSADSIFFVCNDQSEGGEKTAAFFFEDRTPRWTSVFDARDPIFRPHRAVMIRVVGEETEER